MPITSSGQLNRLAKPAKLVIAVAAVWIASILGEVAAKQEPAFPICSGRRLDQQGRCSPDRSRQQSLPACDAWISTFETPLCTGANPLPGDNCIVAPDQFKSCGTRGEYWFDRDGNCVQKYSVPIQTNPVKDGGACAVQS